MAKSTTPPEKLAHRIGARIRAARLVLGWSQGELGRRAKMAAPNVTRLEKGLVLPSLKVLSRVALALDKPMAWFFLGGGADA